VGSPSELGERYGGKGEIESRGPLEEKVVGEPWEVGESHVGERGTHSRDKGGA
jgi:hypothetical protein